MVLVLALYRYNTGSIPSQRVSAFQLLFIPSLHTILGHHVPASETPFEWRFAGRPMMDASWVLVVPFKILQRNPFQQNAISHSYQLDLIIIVLKVVRWYFTSSSFIFNRIVCKHTVETLIRRRVLWRLIWVCTFCLCPQKRTGCLYRLKKKQ